MMVLSRTETYDVLKLQRTQGIRLYKRSRTETYDVLKFPNLQQIAPASHVEPKHTMYWNFCISSMANITPSVEPKHTMYWNLLHTFYALGFWAGRTETYDVLKSLLNNFGNSVMKCRTETYDVLKWRRRVRERLFNLVEPKHTMYWNWFVIWFSSGI